MKNKPSLLEEVANFEQGMDSRKDYIFGSNLRAKIMQKSHRVSWILCRFSFFPIFLILVKKMMKAGSSKSKSIEFYFENCNKLQVVFSERQHYSFGSILSKNWSLWLFLELYVGKSYIR